MNYKKVYDQICERAKSELQNRKIRKKSGEYYEGHHIIPKCLGGTGWANNWNHKNIAPLNAREHFIAHWLLHEMYPENYKLAKAFSMLCSVKDPNQSRYIPSSRIIEYAKIKSSILHSNYMKNEFWSEDMTLHMSKAHMGEKNGMHGKNHSIESREKIKIAYTKERREAASKKLLGSDNPALKSEVKIKMKQKAINRKRVNCPYCDKEGPINQMKQWHFENCKNKKK